MAQKLLIVESPAKAKTIQKYLGPGYKVQASMGHVRDLPKSKLGVDVEHDFAPEYEVTNDKSKIVSELRSAVKNADAVYLATDPDREGEAIAWHVLEAARIPKSKPVFRVTFHEITKNAVQHAVAHPREIDTRLVDAQQARRVLDRLVGYRLSPLLWDKVKRGLSAGRVQSVAVRLVVEREREIENFKPQEYWTIEADLSKQAEQRKFRAVLVERAGKKLGKFDIATKDAADTILADLDSASYRVTKITRKDKKRTAAPPFTTSTLQQEASRKLGFGAKKTMLIAQQLYEGIDIGSEGTIGLITYMRTDSVSVSKQAQDEARALIAQKYGRDYVPEKPNFYKTKAKGAQEAHEAVRPTGVQREPERVRGALNRDQYRLYDLIWKRFVASQMAAAVFDSTGVDIAAGRQLNGNGSAPYLFRATGSVLKFPGFLAVYNVDLDEGEEDEDKEAILPPLTEGELLRLIELLSLQHWTTPPPRYTEASLVKELEKLGIGRPSTYAPTISTIEAREYVQSAEKKLVPTSLGRIVTDLLVEHFPNIVDYNFTSQMEQQLDDIAEGERQWVPVIRNFYGPFEDTISKAQREMRSVKGEAVPTDIDCPTCGSKLGIRLGRNGEFLACTNADCSFTGDLQRDAEGRVQIAAKPQLAEGTQICDKCGREMAVKQGRFGPFLACTGYPECKNIRNLAKTSDGGLAVAEQATEFSCPKCSKPMIRKSGRWGPYLACTDYPDCKTIQKIDRNGQPKPPAQITEKLCPESGHNLALKQGRYGPFLSCIGYPRCRHIEKLPEDGTIPRILSDAEVDALPKPEPIKAAKRTTKAASDTKTTKSTTSAAKTTAKRSTTSAKAKPVAKSKTTTVKRTSRVKQPA